MNPRRVCVVVAGVLAIVAIVFVARNQVRVYRTRQARAVVERQQRAEQQLRVALFDALQPAVLSNCQLERIGEPHDGGYLMCGNLMRGVQSGYSYGISGYDKWGCDISTVLKLTVHQYDCFDTTTPSCPAGRTVFHAECVGDAARTIKGRVFDTIGNQLARNGDGAKRIVLKIDVEGAEWDAFLSMPDEILTRIDQMSVELHWVREKDIRWIHDEKYLRVVQRLKRFFEIGHVHFNNAACVGDLQPFPAWACEVLFVNKRLAVVDRSRKESGPNPLDAPNNPTLADCQPTAR